MRAATMRKLAFSKRLMIWPMILRRTAPGLMMDKVRSKAMRELHEVIGLMIRRARQGRRRADT